MQNFTIKNNKSISIDNENETKKKNKNMKYKKHSKRLRKGQIDFKILHGQLHSGTEAKKHSQTHFKIGKENSVFDDKADNLHSSNDFQFDFKDLINGTPQRQTAGGSFFLDDKNENLSSNNKDETIYVCYSEICSIASLALIKNKNSNVVDNKYLDSCFSDHTIKLTTNQVNELKQYLDEKRKSYNLTYENQLGKFIQNLENETTRTINDYTIKTRQRKNFENIEGIEGNVKVSKLKEVILTDIDKNFNDGRYPEKTFIETKCTANERLHENSYQNYNRNISLILERNFRGPSNKTCQEITKAQENYIKNLDNEIAKITKKIHRNEVADNSVPGKKITTDVQFNQVINQGFIENDNVTCGCMSRDKDSNDDDKKNDVFLKEHNKHSVKFQISNTDNLNKINKSRVREKSGDDTNEKNMFVHEEKNLSCVSVHYLRNEIPGIKSIGCRKRNDKAEYIDVYPFKKERRDKIKNRKTAEIDENGIQNNVITRALRILLENRSNDDIFIVIRLNTEKPLTFRINVIEKKSSLPLGYFLVNKKQLTIALRIGVFENYVSLLLLSTLKFYREFFQNDSNLCVSLNSYLINLLNN